MRRGGSEKSDGVVVLASMRDDAVKIIRVNVTLPAGLLRRIDARTGNRSRFLAKAAEKALAETT